MTNTSKLFSPVRIGPVELRNRAIRSAAFEGMCPGNRPSEELLRYHTSVARGGVGMTTVAYAAVERSGLSFPTQLWMRPEIVPELRELTGAIHAAGAKASVQLGHCGNMSHASTAGQMPISASTGFNIYSPTPVRGMREDEITAMAGSFGRAVELARQAGFDCVEIHAGHGYLISQFLSPWTNRRHDRWGGTLDNRMRFMRLCMEKVMEAAGSDMGVVVKMNMDDGFKAGMHYEEAIEVARELQRLGAHALVLSGGFVSRAPMYVMRGAMPIGALTHYMDCQWLKWSVRAFGRMMIPTVPYEPCYFLDQARRFRQELAMPLIYVGGCSTAADIERVLGEGFDAVQMARALLACPDFINRIRDGKATDSGCLHTNYCIGRMYSREMACHQKVWDELPPCLQREAKRLECKR